MRRPPSSAHGARPASPLRARDMGFLAGVGALLLLAFGCDEGPRVEIVSLHVGDNLNCALVGEVAADAGVDAASMDAGDDASMDAGDDASVDAGDDAGVEDAGIEDAGVEDAGIEDAGPMDAGTDAGMDAGPMDAGPMDAGDDAGADAGPDAGPTTSRLGTLRCWGDGEPRPTDQLTVGEVSEVVLGSGTHCALRVEGWVCWGDNDRGQFAGATSAGTAPTPLPLSLDTLAVARFGGAFLCGTQMGEEGPGLLCWGANDAGQLGRGTQRDAQQPQLVPLEGTLLSYGLGVDHACAATTNGIFCWGSGAEGKTGRATLMDTALPLPVPMPNMVRDRLAEGMVPDFALGRVHSCMLLSGDVWCWGGDELGQMGQRTRGFVPAGQMVQVDVQEVTQLATGADHLCTLSNRGIRCWGANQSEQLGILTEPIGIVTPFGSRAADAIHLGLAHTCTVDQGTVRCWGDGTQGQLGPTETQPQNRPVLVGGIR